MAAKKREKRAARSVERQMRHKGFKTKDFAAQPAGQPQGKHLTGFKGMKIDQLCECGGCHPNAKAAAGRTRVINA